jgi:hypothetical protein
LSEQRVLGRTDTRLVTSAGLLLLVIAVLGLFFPYVLIAPLAFVLIWMSIALLTRAGSMRKERRSQGLPSTRVRQAAPTNNTTSLPPARPARQQPPS